MTSILVVEDDPRIASQLVGRLKRDGFSVELIQNGEVAVQTCLAQPFDMILLDLGLPGMSGFEVMDALRHRCSVPILVLTAQQDLEGRVRSFRSGAVDWMAKPFFMEELLERIRVRLHQREVSATRFLTKGRLHIDLDKRTLSVSDKPVVLGAIEFNLLTYLIEREGRAISRQQLIQHVLSPDSRHTERTIDSHIAHIRGKLGDVGQAIRTVWGIGYRFDEERA